MRDRTAVAILVVVSAAVAVGFYSSSADLPAEATPNATFDIEADIATDELVVEHDGGESLSSGSVRILVYEDRPIVPDRTVHGTVWETESGFIQPGDRIELDDPRFEPGQRVVIRWFGDGGQANLYETTIR
ncbi:MAG: type IV pilin [Natronomonas sp.]